MCYVYERVHGAFSGSSVLCTERSIYKRINIFYLREESISYDTFVLGWSIYPTMEICMGMIDNM